MWLQSVDTHLTAMDTKDPQAQTFSTWLVIDGSQISYRPTGGTKWVLAVTSPARLRANLEGAIT